MDINLNIGKTGSTGIRAYNTNFDELGVDYFVNQVDVSDIDESSYQYTYDETNDWFREKFTPTDLQNAFIVGAMWMRQRMLIEKYSKNNK